ARHRLTVIRSAVGRDRLVVGLGLVCRDGLVVAPLHVRDGRATRRRARRREVGRLAGPATTRGLERVVPGGGRVARPDGQPAEGEHKDRRCGASHKSLPGTYAGASGGGGRTGTLRLKPETGRLKRIGRGRYQFAQTPSAQAAKSAHPVRSAQNKA